jgi:hypothetical protein
LGHALEILLILVVNFIVIFILFGFQKRLVEKNLRHLKDEVQELEDLVAAIIEEFEEVAGLSENPTTRTIKTTSGKQEPNSVYPTADDFLENLDDNDFTEMIRKSAFNGNRLSEVSHTKNFDPANQKKVEPAAEINHNELETPDNDRQPDNSPPDNVQEGAKSDTIMNEEFINDPKHRQIIDLWRQGTTIEEIARQLGTGRGEIQLILGIYRRS